MSDGHAVETATATVLFTDLVRSTEIRAELGDAAADDIRRRHDAALTEVIEANGGRVVKGLGDGLMAVFDAAADAVAAGIGAQQAVTAIESDAGPLSIRVGVSVGDVTFEDGDCFGAAVNEAARLCATAQGGQILVADLVRGLARGRPGFIFEPVGELELKGIPDPVPACSVGWEPLPRMAAGAVPFPPALAPPTAGGYIGRPDVLTALGQLWAEAKRDGMRTALLVGEPGIGKTRTAYEVARMAAQDGAIVLFGRCDDQLRMPYQPFAEALDWQVRHGPDLPLGRLGGELQRLVPEIAEARPDLGPPVSSDARTEEHRLFEATASWIVETARSSGMVLVLDDLHWATKPSLLMLTHVVRAASDESVRLLVIGTYRDTDLDRTHPLSSVLGDLRRLDGVHRILIDPLSPDEVIELIAAAAGHELDDNAVQLAVRAHQETEGNPFFVAEVLRHLVETGGVRFVDGRWTVPDPDHVDVPEGVRDVVGQRLSRLTETANDVLRAAAVVGRDFDLDLVAELAGVDEDAVLDATDEASRARLIEETDADRFRFTHALVRTTLYEELSASRLRRMHRRIVNWLVEHRPDDITSLAHHAVEAGPSGGDLSQAIEFVLRAGEAAHAARAYSEAESYFLKALELLDEDEADRHDRRRLATLCGLGEAQRDQGNPAFRETLLSTARIAAAAGNTPMLVRAALANTRGFTSVIGSIDEERLEVLEQALTRAETTEARIPLSDLIKLRAILATELVFDDTRREERLALADRALEESAALDPHDEAFVRSLIVNCTQVPERWSDMLDATGRLVQVAEATRDPTLLALATGSHSLSHLHRCDLVRAHELLTRARHIADEGATPFAEWWIRSLECQYQMHEGHQTAALAASDAALELGTLVGAPDAPSWWAAIYSSVTNILNRENADVDQVGAFADGYPLSYTWRAVHVNRLAQTGRIREARALIERHGLDKIAAVPRDMFWFATMLLLSHTASIIDDAEMGREIHEALAPYDGAGCHYFLIFLGTVELPRAYADLARGHVDEAIEHLERELRWARDQSLALTVVTEVELARALTRRGEPGDVARARELAASAHDRATADGVEMAYWATEAGRLAGLA